MAAVALLVQLVLLPLLQITPSKAAIDKFPCNFTVEEVIKQAGWQQIGPRGPQEPVLECTANGTIHTIFLTGMAVSGNISGFTPWMKDMSVLDLTKNHIYGKRRETPTFEQEGLSPVSCVNY